MDIPGTNSFESICRACMSKGTHVSLFMNDEELLLNFGEMLYYCTEIEVDMVDQLPSKICSNCMKLLGTLYRFKQTAIDCDKVLRQMLRNCLQNKQQKLDTLDALKLPIFNSVQSNLHYKENNEPAIKPLLQMIDYKPGEDMTESKVEVVRKKSKFKITKKNLHYFQCETCGNVFSCRSNLIQHIRKHTGEKPFSCDLCEKKFARSEHVAIHRRIHTGERPYPCSFCQKRFVQYAALSSHLRTHTGEKPHMCAVCGKSFSQSISLTYHMRTHTGETPYQCQLCNKSFSNSGYLNIHTRFHMNERKFHCNMCNRRFVTSSHLALHVKQHTGDRPHQCSVCGKAFTRSEHLKDHLVIHTGEKPHVCSLCSKRYTQSSHLSRHMKSHKESNQIVYEGT